MRKAKESFVSLAFLYKLDSKQLNAVTHLTFNTIGEGGDQNTVHLGVECFSRGATSLRLHSVLGYIDAQATGDFHFVQRGTACTIAVPKSAWQLAEDHLAIHGSGVLAYHTIEEMNVHQKSKYANEYGPGEGPGSTNPVLEPFEPFMTMGLEPGKINVMMY
jgi:hypothetical protein